MQQQRKVFKILNKHQLRGQQPKRNSSQMNKHDNICNKCIQYTIRWFASIAIIFKMNGVLQFYLFTIGSSSILNNLVLILIQLHLFMCEIYQLICDLVVMLTFGMVYHYILDMYYNVCEILYIFICFFRLKFLNCI